MKNDRSILAALSAVSGLLASTAALAACPAGSHMAGLVQSISGPRGEISLQRGGAAIGPAVALPLCAGDAVVISGPDSKLTAKLFDGTTQTYSQGRHEIAAAGSANMLWRVVEEKIEAFAPEVQTYGHGLVGRDAAPTPYEFSASGLASGQAKVSANWSDISVRWIGGVGPYVVELHGPGGEAVQAPNVAEHNAKLAVGHLTPGVWQISVKDLVGRELKGSFTVDASLGAPAMSPDGPFAELNDALSAVSMAGQGDLTFQAEQVLASAPQQGLDRGPFYTAIACQTGAGERKNLCGHAGAAAAPPVG